MREIILLFCLISMKLPNRSGVSGSSPITRCTIAASQRRLALLCWTREGLSSSFLKLNGRLGENAEAGSVSFTEFDEDAVHVNFDGPRT